MEPAEAPRPQPEETPPEAPGRLRPALACVFPLCFVLYASVALRPGFSWAGVLDAIASRTKQLEALANAQLVLVAVADDRLALDQLHGEEGVPVGSGPGRSALVSGCFLFPIRTFQCLSSAPCLAFPERRKVSFADYFESTIVAPICSRTLVDNPG